MGIAVMKDTALRTLTILLQVPQRTSTMHLILRQRQRQSTMNLTIFLPNMMRSFISTSTTINNLILMNSNRRFWTVNFTHLVTSLKQLLSPCKFLNFRFVKSV